ncbi:MAG: response regulator [Desulfobacterales bacterium]
MNTKKKELTENLLVIDDEQEILKSLNRQFRRRYNVHLAGSADEGCRILCEEPIQVIISDQRMPGLTGTEFFHKIKTEHPDAIRLILTAYADIEAVIAAINQGNVFRYLQKPWDPELLDSVVSEAFRHYWLINGNRKLMQELKETNEILRGEIGKKEQAQRELCQHRDSLERIVRERTESLSRSNAMLYQEIEGHRQTAAELRTAKERADSANRAKSEFLAHMSHELRTPLNGILGYAQILKKDRSLSESQRAGIEIIERSGNHLLNLLNDILDLSKIEAGKMELNPMPLAFPPFLKGICEMVSIRAQEKGLVFRHEISPALPYAVLADEQRLGQVLLNLLNNAIKFTDAGSVIFRVQPLETERKDNFSPVRFQVKDTGLGIPEDQLEDVFSPFRQVGSHMHKTKGTGLGLTISRNLVRLMGGEISVRSELKKGSVFFFDLKLPETSDPAEIKYKADKGTVLGFQGQKRRILVVDDKKENRSLISDMLSPLGFEILEAENGREGVAKTLEFMPDLIFMDLIMPVMDGFAAAERIRQRKEIAQPCIIALSADIFDEARNKSLAAGCDDYVSKPFVMDKILEKMRKHLHLEWIYEENMPDPENAGRISANIIPPPADILADLKKMAEMGDIGALRDKSGEMLAGDAQFIPFAKEIRRLTKSFEIDRIQQLLEKCGSV